VAAEGLPTFSSPARRETGRKRPRRGYQSWVDVGRRPAAPLSEIRVFYWVAEAEEEEGEVNRRVKLSDKLQRRGTSWHSRTSTSRPPSLRFA